MIKINLLPFRAARKKENIRRQVSVYLLMLILVSMALIYYNITLRSKVKVLNADVQQITAEVAGFQVKADKVDAIKAKLAVLEKKNGVIKTLQLNRFEPVRLLDYMTKAVVVDRMWFTKLSEIETITVAKPPKPKPPNPNQPNIPPPPPPEDIVTKTVTVKGVALDNKTIADFMTGLESLPVFSSVKLINIEHEEIRDIKMKKFEITCVKAPPKQASKG